MTHSAPVLWPQPSCSWCTTANVWEKPNRGQEPSGCSASHSTAILAASGTAKHSRFRDATRRWVRNGAAPKPKQECSLSTSEPGGLITPRASLGGRHDVNKDRVVFRLVRALECTRPGLVVLCLHIWGPYMPTLSGTNKPEKTSTTAVCIEVNSAAHIETHSPAEGRSGSQSRTSVN